MKRKMSVLILVGLSALAAGFWTIETQQARERHLLNIWRAPSVSVEVRAGAVNKYMKTGTKSLVVERLLGPGVWHLMHDINVGRGLGADKSSQQQRTNVWCLAYAFTDGLVVLGFYASAERTQSESPFCGAHAESETVLKGRGVGP